MRSYGQYCALARALDVVGERWTLLIIRELFADDCRYSDLRDALPGIATNLLADRLRRLQSDGLVEAYAAPRPVRASVYRLTARGRQLGPALRGLVAFGGGLATEQGGDAFRTHWLALGLPTFFSTADVADLAPLTVLLDTGDQPAVLEVTADAGVTARVGTPSGAPDLEVTGSPDRVFAVLTGTAGTQTSPEVDIRGPRSALRLLHALAARSTLASGQVASRA